MQSTVDGDVRLSVGLDAKEAQDGIKDIAKNVEKIFNALENQSSKLTSRFDTLNNSVTSIATSLSELRGYFVNISTIQLPQEPLERLATGITGVNNQFEATVTQEQAVVGATESIDTSIQNVAESAAVARENIQQISETTSNMSVAENQFADIDAVAERLADLEDKQRALSSQGITSGTQWDELAQQIRAAEIEYNRLEDKYSTLETLTRQFNALEGAVQEYNNRLSALRGQDGTFDEESQEVEALYQELTKAVSLLDLVRKRIEYVRQTGNTDYKATEIQQLSHNQQQQAEFAEQQLKIEEQIDAYVRQLTADEEKHTKAVKKNTVAVENNNNARRNINQTEVLPQRETAKMQRQLTQLANIAKSVTSRINGFASAFSRFFSRLSKFTTKASKNTDKSFKNINKSINRGIVNLLKYTLGIRSIYILINKLRRAGIDSFKSLIKQSEPLNKTISETYSAFINLKNAIGPAFQPLVSVVAPILTRFADSLTNVTYKLGEFFAAVTGQKYVYKAIKVQKDYAKTLDKTDEKLKENLASFDKLNVLSEKSDDTTDENKVEYETKPLSDTFNTIKSLIDSQDWEGIGQRIAQRINVGLSAVKKALSWENIGGTITNFVLAFTRIFNALVDNVDWNLLGETVGKGINTIVNTLNLLLTSVDWRNLGTQLATGLNGMVETVDWTNIGQLIGNWFMKSWNTFYGFVKNLDFSKIGKAIAEGINGFFETFDFSTVTSSVATFVNGLSEILSTTTKETNWGEAVDNIAEGINTTLSETDWGKLASGLSESATTVLDTLIDTLASVDWQKFGSSLIDFIINIDWGGLVNSLFRAIGTAIGGIAGIIKGIWDNLTKVQEDFWNEQFSETGGNIALGILNGLIDIWKGIGTWIRDNVFRPFAEGIWKAFGAWDFEQSVEKWLEENVWQPVFDLFNTVWTWVTGLADKFKKAFIKVVEAIKQPFKNIADWFKNTFSKAWEAVKNVFSTGGKIFEGIKEGIANVFRTVVNSLIDGINTIIAVPFDTVNNMLNTIRNVTIPIINKQPFADLWGENPLPVPQIPKLAQGTVVPANFGSFLAELGDNKREPEIVSPVSKIEEAVENVLKRTGNFFSGDGKIEINLNVDGKALYSVIVSQDEIQKKQHGGRSRLGTAAR